VDTIVSVSGGSILAAFLARNIKDQGWPIASQDWDARIAEPFRRIAAKGLFPLLPFSWALPGMYDRSITRGLALADLPDHGPRFRFCASDLNFGVPWIFSKKKVGNYLRGFIHPGRHKANWMVADAVATSACFPPVFRPMHIDLSGMNPEGGTNNVAKALPEALLNATN
jgi:NTE family protein